MRKLITIFFLLIYTSVGFGLAINYHYCGKSLTKISVLNFGGQSGCGCNESDMPMNCCKDQIHCAKADKHKMVQPAIVQKVVSFNLVPLQIINYPEKLTVANDLVSYSTFLLNKRINSVPIFLLTRDFRI